MYTIWQSAFESENPSKGENILPYGERDANETIKVEKHWSINAMAVQFSY